LEYLARTVPAEKLHELAVEFRIDLSPSRPGMPT
jgi:hypothetical protein